MVYLILAVAIVAVLWLGLNWFANASPAVLAANTRVIGLVGAIGIAALLALIGRWSMVAPLALFAVSLASRRFSRSRGRRGSYGGPAGARGSRTHTHSRPSPNQRSTVRTESLEMTLEHDSGAIEGRVLAGPLAGRMLETLSVAEIGTLYRDLGDERSRALLEAYLDRRMPRWREDFEADAATGRGRAADPGSMSKKEAYQILGLAEGADEAEIRSAHRRLMKRVHPDQGGSAFLAARINEAKERLLDGHR